MAWNTSGFFNSRVSALCETLNLNIQQRNMFKRLGAGVKKTLIQFA